MVLPVLFSSIYPNHFSGFFSCHCFLLQISKDCEFCSASCLASLKQIYIFPYGIARYSPNPVFFKSSTVYLLHFLWWPLSCKWEQSPEWQDSLLCQSGSWKCWKPVSSGEAETVTQSTVGSVQCTVYSGECNHFSWQIEIHDCSLHEEHLYNLPVWHFVIVQTI